MRLACGTCWAGLVAARVFLHFAVQRRNSSRRSIHCNVAREEDNSVRSVARSGQLEACTCPNHSLSHASVQKFLARAEELLKDDPQAMKAVGRLNAAAEKVRSAR